MSKYQAAFEKMNQLDCMLKGMPVNRIPHELLFRVIEKIERLGMIYFVRDGHNVRATKCTPEIEKVIGIPQSGIEGYLLTDFVKIEPEEVWRSIQHVDKHGFMVKSMMLGTVRIPTRAWIVRIDDGVYFEIVWRLEDEID